MTKYMEDRVSLLADTLSPAARIEPALIRRVRCNHPLVKGVVEVAAEAVFWQEYQGNSLLCTIPAVEVSRRRRRLAKMDGGHFSTSARLIREVHNQPGKEVPVSIRWEEEVVHHSYLNRMEGAEEKVREALRAMIDPTRYKALSHWWRKVYARLPTYTGDPKRWPKGVRGMEAAVLCCVVAGCEPQEGSQPLTPEDRAWAEYIRDQLRSQTEGSFRA